MVAALTFIIGKLEVVIHGGDKLLHKEAPDAGSQVFLAFHLTLQHISVEIWLKKTQHISFSLCTTFCKNHKNPNKFMFRLWQKRYNILKSCQRSMFSPDLILSRIRGLTHQDSQVFCVAVSVNFAQTSLHSPASVG